MEIINITNSTRLETGTVATVGFFDGVHRGHRYLLHRLKEEAQQQGLKTAVITFPVHPRKVLQQDYQPQLLNTLEERLHLLAAAGVDYVYVIDFTPEFAKTSAKDFILKIVGEQLQVKELLVGYDHRFGQGRAGNYEEYAAYGQEAGVRVAKAEKLPDTDEHISSTVIRRWLSEGKVKEAANALSYPYTLEGVVVHGDHLGRTIGFPTANMDLTDKQKIIPREGVYAVLTTVAEQEYKGMAYIGHRPTVTQTGEKRVEVNIFDFSQDIYGETIRVEFLDFLRPDIHFNGLDALKAQLAKDREAAVIAGAIRNSL